MLLGVVGEKLQLSHFTVNMVKNKEKIENFNRAYMYMHITRVVKQLQIEMKYFGNKSNSKSKSNCNRL